MTKLASDLTGQQFGKITVVAVDHKNSHGTRIYSCLCDCGITRLVKHDYLVNGSIYHCGCLSHEIRQAAHTTHGLTHHPLYSVWHGIKTRCCNPNAANYPRYGGRGITMCDRWQNSFVAFLTDMGKRPENSSIDRIDIDGPYSPENCRWSTPKQQSRNTSTNALLTYEGKTQTVTEWAEELHINRTAIYGRLRNGWSTERIMTTPVDDRCNWRSLGKPRLLEFDGKALTQSEWSKLLNIPDYVIYNRLHAGWTAERTLSTPYQPARR